MTALLTVCVCQRKLEREDKWLREERRGEEERGEERGEEERGEERRREERRREERRGGERRGEEENNGGDSWILNAIYIHQHKQHARAHTHARLPQIGSEENGGRREGGSQTNTDARQSFACWRNIWSQPG